MAQTSSDRRTRARLMAIVGDEVAIVWEDGHESYFAGVALRKACTCAACKGEQHLFGRATLPTLKPMSAAAFRPVAVRPVGNYGMQVVWGDGHEHGIYHFNELRATCSCEPCRGTASLGPSQPGNA